MKRIPQGRRCIDPDYPRWRKPLQWPELELDVERESGEHEKPGVVKVAIARIALVRKAGGR